MSEIISWKEEKMDYEVIGAEEAKAAGEKIAAIVDNIETVIIGKREKVTLTVLCMLAGGHILIEDIPGVGKTSLVSALAKTISAGYKRIQFTPDVMPSDVTGFSVFNQKTGEFTFRPGAVMSNIVLADEINRASAKTQSALLEIMEERQVTVDSKTYPMETPFMVLATQNPIESLGTYPLPEAQIDRFMVKLSLGYPSFENEVDIVLHGRQAKEKIRAAATAEEIRALMEQARRVRLNKAVAAYIVRLVTATRETPDAALGSSPRGSIALYTLSKAYALSQGRNYVVPDDVKYLAPYVLSHRIRLSRAAKKEKRDPADVIRELAGRVLVPAGEDGAED